MKNIIEAHTPKPVPDFKTMTIAQIAKVIVKDWKNINYAAKPYLQAMNELRTIDDTFGMDSGASIVRYFLSNAGAYRGVTAKAVKTELRTRLKTGV